MVYEYGPVDQIIATHCRCVSILKEEEDDPSPTDTPRPMPCYLSYDFNKRRFRCTGSCTIGTCKLVYQVEQVGDMFHIIGFQCLCQ